MKIKRFYFDLENWLFPNKVLVIFGPRQVGKTTLLIDYLKKTKYKYRFDNGDDVITQDILGSQNLERLKDYASGYELIVIDEAQKIKNIGMGLKILVDHIPGIRIIATGSSSFELAGQVGEPLTGRKRTLTLFPVAMLELLDKYNRFELDQQLEKLLIYGNYPDIVTQNDKREKIQLVNDIAHSYLLKDILELERVKGAKILIDLLRLLAFQVGSEVSLNELGSNVGLDKKTIARYLDILEKSFVIFNVRGFSRNLRKEITKKSKYYFYDNGIRNALIANFNSLALRNDTGILWENFLFMERMKKRSYHNIYSNIYFWRTWDQKEIDLIEERDGKLYGFEFKWGAKMNKPPKDWIENYEEAEYKIINPDNYLDFIL